jgi:hypothetical protein
MKPRLFVGSSTEGLELAYAVQSNLEHDALVTVWTQSVFQLTSNTLADLVKTLGEFDFAIMIFKPDDILNIRKQVVSTVRDNVVFELGLFIGRLGTDRVFYVIPANEKDFHLPTDLTGINPGTYESQRPDGNVQAALGPFCNDVRKKLKLFVYDNLNDLTSESKESRTIAIEKPIGWEFLLASQMLEERLVHFNRGYEELTSDTFFIRSDTYDADRYKTWFDDRLNDYGKMLNALNPLMINLVASFGEPGVAGKAIEIKLAVDRIDSLTKELLAWQYSFRQ